MELFLKGVVILGGSYVKVFVEVCSGLRSVFRVTVRNIVLCFGVKVEVFLRLVIHGVGGESYVEVYVKLRCALG